MLKYVLDRTIFTFAIYVVNLSKDYTQMILIHNRSNQKYKIGYLLNWMKRTRWDLSVNMELFGRRLSFCILKYDYFKNFALNIYWF